MMSATLSLSDLKSLSDDLSLEISKTIIGLDNHVKILTLSLLTGGHVLLDGLPGTAKTSLAVSFSQSLGLDKNRIQSTPDMMPGDITGTRIYNPKTLEFDFHAGPIFANIVIVDEINRAPPRSQAALLEAMQEGQVTVDGATSYLDKPFMVVATKNPLEYEGTFPLSPTQLDRFMFKLNLDYPNSDDAISILKSKSSSEVTTSIISKDTILNAQNLIMNNTSVDDNVSTFIAKVVKLTRNTQGILLGASPTASVSLLNAARGYAAVINGKDSVTIDDVKAVAFDVLNHRLVVKQSDITDYVETEGDFSIEKIISDILESASGE